MLDQKLYLTAWPLNEDSDVEGVGGPAIRGKECF